MMAKQKIKLKWYKDVEPGQSDAGVEEAEVWRAEYKNYLVTVYPAELLNENANWWEYRIEDIKSGREIYDSAYQSYPGSGIIAKTAKEAKEKAIIVLKEIIEEGE
jgi:hypothetical protein